MQESADHVSMFITQAKTDLERRSERMLHVYSFVPDDKLNWSPSATARSSMLIVAHCAVVCRFVTDALTGKLPETMPSVEEFFKVQGEAEKEIVANQDVAAAVKESVAELSRAIDTVTAEDIDSLVHTPFGPMPRRFVMSIALEQFAGHTGQLEYLQTIWGDMDNHMG